MSIRQGSALDDDQSTAYESHSRLIIRDGHKTAIELNFAVAAIFLSVDGHWRFTPSHKPHQNFSFAEAAPKPYRMARIKQCFDAIGSGANGALGDLVCSLHRVNKC
jgi:hypothetical protein